jgi:hypothetical protein
MVAENESIPSTEAASAWAKTMLRAKNTLTSNDARSVEGAFETRLVGLADVATSEPIAQAPVKIDAVVLDANSKSPSSAINGSPSERTLPITKTVRHRNQEHLRFVRVQPCLVCAKQPSDPHHLSFAQPRALGRKVSDEYTVPLCRAHHRELHRATKEIPWWHSHGIAPLAVAEALWQKSQSGRALNEAVEPSVKPPQWGS